MGTTVRRLFFLLLGLAILAACACAQNPITEYKYWSISAGAALGGSMVDGATSAYALDYRHTPGVIETNPVIVKINQGNNKVFGPGAFGVKVGVWGGLTAGEWWALRKIEQHSSPGGAEKAAKIFSILNWGIAAWYDGIAVHNARVVKLIK